MYPIVSIDSSSSSPSTSSSDSIQFNSILYKGRFVITVQIENREATALTQSQAIKISKACRDAVANRQFLVMEVDSEEQLSSSWALLDSDHLTPMFREAFQSYVGQLDHGIVFLESASDPSESPVLQIYSTGTKKSVDSIMVHVSQLALFKSIPKGQQVKIRCTSIGSKPLPQKSCTDIYNKIMDLMRSESSQAGCPLVGYSAMPNETSRLASSGDTRTVSSSQGPKTRRIQAFDDRKKPVAVLKGQVEQSSNDMQKKVTIETLSVRPKAKQRKLPQSLLNALKKLNPAFQSLSIIQLVELLVFRTIGHRLAISGSSQSSPSSSSPSSSSLSVISSSGPIRIGGTGGEVGVFKDLLIEKDMLDIFSEFVRFLAHGGVMRCSSHTSLKAIEEYLRTMSEQKNARRNAVEGISIEIFVQLLNYFSIEQSTDGDGIGYQMHPAILSSFRQPIQKLWQGAVHSSGKLVMEVPLLAYHVPALAWTLLTVPNRVELSNREHFLSTVKPSAYRVVDVHAAELNWSEAQTQKANELITYLIDRFFIEYDTGHSLLDGWSQILTPLLRLFPSSRIARLLQEGNQDAICRYIDRNIDDLIELSEGLNQFLTLFDVNHEGFKEWKNHFHVLIPFCCDDLEQLLNSSAEENYARFKTLIIQEEHARQWTAKLFDFLRNPMLKEVVQQFSLDFATIQTRGEISQNLFSAGKDLIAHLFNSVLPARKRYSEAAEMARELMESSSSSSSSRKFVRSGGRDRKKSRGRVAKPLPAAKKQTDIPAEERTDHTPLKPLVCEAPIAYAHDRILTAFSAFGTSTLNNKYALQSWESSTEFYKDLVAELVDAPNPGNPTHVSEYVNRIVVTLSLLVEQVVSTHVLERHQPMNIIQRQSLLSHESKRMLVDSGLEEKIAGIRDVVAQVSGLEILARNLKTNHPRDSIGAQLLYRADELTAATASSSSFGSFYDAQTLLGDTHNLVVGQLDLLCRILDIEIDLDAFRGVGNYQEGLDSTDSQITNQLIKKAMEIQGRMDVLIGSGTDGYLCDAARLLGLMQARLERHSENGNVRNFYKMLATSMALVLEFTAMSLGEKSGNQDLANMRSHCLTDWFELLGLTNLSLDEELLLESCVRVHNLTRYSANYRAVQGRSSAQDIYLQMIKRLAKSDAMTHGGISDSSWISADRELKSHVRKAVADIRSRIEIGLGLAHKLLLKLE